MTLVFVDESIHDRADFIVTSLVYADESIQQSVDHALIECGYVPGIDEFKSGSRMLGNDRAHALRDRIQGIVIRETKLALVVSGRAERDRVGNYALSLAIDVAERTKSRPRAIYFDEGIQVDRSCCQEGWSLETGQNSKKVGGIQVADCAAFGAAMLLLAELGLNVKKVPPGDYYPSEEPLELAWLLWTGLRYPMSGEPYFEPKDDRFQFERKPYGLMITPGCPPAVRQAVEQRLGLVWLGCIY